jgi:hypothetical protein
VLRRGGTEGDHREGFYADLSQFSWWNGPALRPASCGGNCYLLRNRAEVSMVDTGFGILLPRPGPVDGEGRLGRGGNVRTS